MLSDAIPSRCVHVPHFFGGNSPNALSSYESDPVSGVPTYKASAVKIEAVK
jgi:anaerobic selenocysteine-containing dehydrogenase